MAAADLGPFGPLCLCGIRGCDLAEQHANGFAEPVPMWRKGGARSKRRQRKR